MQDPQPQASTFNFLVRGHLFPNNCGLTPTDFNHSQTDSFSNTCCLIFESRQIANRLQSVWVSLHHWAQLICAMSLCNIGLDWLVTGCLLDILLYKSIAAEPQFHFAVKLLACSNYVTILEGLSFHIYKILTEGWIVHVNFYQCRCHSICSFCRFIIFKCYIITNRL